MSFKYPGFEIAIYTAFWLVGGVLLAPITNRLGYTPFWGALVVVGAIAGIGVWCQFKLAARTLVVLHTLLAIAGAVIMVSSTFNLNLLGRTLLQAYIAYRIHDWSTTLNVRT